jgi:tetratricopeptide (TPR) repeat protein
MRKVSIILGLAITPLLVGAGVYWQHNRSVLEGQLAEARAAVGTNAGSAILERLANQYPDSAEVQFLLSRQLIAEGKPDVAEGTLSKALALGWPRAEVERQRWIAVSYRDFRQAEPPLLGFLDVNANDRDVLLALAAGYHRHKRFKLAESLLDRLLKISPDDGQALLQRGEVRLQLLQVDQAEKDLKKAYAQAKDRPYEYKARFLLATGLRQLGQAEKALELYRVCCAEAPRDVAAFYGLALCLRFLNRPDDALAAFQHVLELKPDEIETLLQVAYLYDERGELDKAIEVLAQIEKMYPEEPQMLVQMGKTLQAKGDMEGAAKYRKRSEDLRRHWEDLNAKERQKSAK